MTGSGEQPVALPKAGGTGPPIRVPDQPPSRRRLFFEHVIKWGAITLVVLFLALFIYMVIFGFEKELTQAELEQTQVARER